MVAQDAHWSPGLVERRILTLKEMLVKVVRDFPAQSPLMMRVAVTQCAHTINRIANNHGFSPAQCVLGVNPQLRYPMCGQFTSSYDDRSQLPDDEAIAQCGDAQATWWGEVSTAKIDWGRYSWLPASSSRSGCIGASQQHGSCCRKWDLGVL